MSIKNLFVGALAAVVGLVGIDLKADAGTSALRELPYGYCAVEYIQSSGAQYIDTGIGKQDKLRVVFDLVWTAVKANQYMMGRYDGTTTKQYVLNLSADAQWRTCVNVKSLHVHSSLPVATNNTRYTVQTYFNGATHTMTVNGLSDIYTSGKTQSSVPNDHLYLFGYTAGTSLSANAKLYSCQMYTNVTDETSGVLARDYVPAYNFDTKQYGLYDFVTKTFYPSASSTGFTGPTPPPQVIRYVAFNVTCDTTKQTYEAKTNSVLVTGSAVASNAVVTIVATPAIGYAYAEIPTGWEAGTVAKTITKNVAASENPTEITIPDATESYCELTLTDCTNGSIQGAKSGDRIRENETITLRAQPAEGCVFVRWTGDASGFGNPAVVKMDVDKTIGALFAVVPADYPQGEEIEIPEAEGWVRTIGLDTIVVFTNAAKNCTFALPAGVTNIDYLVVAGGGSGGGSEYGGGGGAGGMVYATQQPVADGDTLAIRVGAGGAISGTFKNGNKGKDSTLSNASNESVRVTAVGGGYGAYNFQTVGGSGGSGGGNGGGGQSKTHSLIEGGLGTEGQGYNGGGSTNNVSGNVAGSGGGGAGAPGTCGTGVSKGGLGGDGLPCSITGEEVHYAGGGTGGSTSTTYARPGGQGGGGAGARGGNGGNGTDGLGGGGGGAGYNSNKGGKGGSGVVVLRFGYVSHVGPYDFCKLTLTPPENGTITGAVSGEYKSGQALTLTAKPESGYRFVGWGDDAESFGSQKTIEIVLASDMTVSAVFEKDEYALTITAPENGTIVGGTSGTYPNGTKLTLTATPAEGYFFAGWTVNGASAGKDASLSVTVDANKTVAARFDPLVYTGDVRITEFSAKNSTVVSACGQKECDWIELTNYEPYTIQLAGWGLTSKKKDHYLAKIPEGVAIGGGETLLIFCGDTTEVCAKGELHVALSLSKDAGKFIGLYDANDKEMTAITYPAQMNDVSYGYGYLNPSDPEAELRELYFKEITPGAANTNRGYTVKTPTVVISEPHGYKTEPFDLTISCPDNPDAVIYYTTNGKPPTTADNLYTGAVHVAKTTCIRAGVPDPDAIFQHDASATYLYLTDILQQPRYRDNSDDNYAWKYAKTYDFYKNLGFPQSRVDSLNSQHFHYGFNPDSLAKGDMRQRTLEGMTNGIDTISIVIDPSNLFGKTKGIYVNAFEDGRDWERQTMVECICPTNSANDFSISAGLRIRGGSSRQYMYPKHSFRLYFRNEYGVDALEKPIFGDERGAVSKFSKMDLRTSQNWSVAGDKSKHDTFIHETFLRDAQGKLGQPYTRSRYYHLYINGVYWGMYETQERGDEDYAESYLGGDADDYDVIKRSTAYNGKEILGAAWDIAAGNKTAYNQLCTLSSQGFTGANSNNYLKAMGKNPDGTRNLEYPILLDDDNLMAYVLINHYVNNSDSAFSLGTGKNASLNNLYAIRNRVDDETGAGHNGFIFLCHDGEHSFGTDTTFDVLDSGKTTNQTRKVSCHYTGDRTLAGTSEIHSSYANPITTGLFGPAQLNYRLMQNDEYRMKFADLVYRTCLKEGGVLTIPEAKKIFTNRMAQIDNAIAAEYARWDWSGYALPTYDTWTNACAECFEFIDKRLDYLIPQYRKHGWYPLVDAPIAEEFAGTVTLATTNAEWTIYYTTDGSDPRLAGGATNGAAQVYTAAIPVGEDDLALRARVVSASGEWSALETLDVKGAAPDLQAVNVRWWGFCGQPDVGDDGDGEFIILTNLNQSAAVSLEGLEIRICKTGDAAAKCQFTLGAGVSVAAGGFIRLNHADYPKAVGWEKITNGNVDLRLKSAQGTAFNEFAALSQKSLGVQASGKFAVRDFKDDISWTTMAIADAPGGTQPTPPPGPQPGGDVISGDFPNGTNIVLTAATTLKLGDATFGKPLAISGAAATLELQAGTTATIPAVTVSGAALTIDGTGTLTLAGTNTLITSTDFIVSNGVLNLTFTNAAAKACAVNLLGNFKQYGGTVNLALESANQVYGFYCNVKEKSAKIHGGVLNATIDGGESSAAFKLNKGSNDFEFKGGAVNVTLGGRAPRFVNADGEIKFDGSRVTIETMKGLAETSRVFKCAKDLTIKDGVVTGKAKGLGSEIFSADGMIKVKGGVVSVEADDDCFSAGTNLVVSAGKVQALSYNGDAIDSNGPMTISGGYVFATTLSPLHEGLDVDPKDGGSANKLIITGGSVVATGGANNLHAPDVGSVVCYTNANITSMKKYLVLTGKRKSTVTKLSVNLESGKKRNADGFSLIATVPNQVGTYTDTKTKPSEDTPKGVKLDDDLDGVFLTIYSTATVLTID